MRPSGTSSSSSIVPYVAVLPARPAVHVASPDEVEAVLLASFTELLGDEVGYIRAQRLEYGRRLLLDGGREIGGIARSAGYRNQGAFTDAFKRAYGTTPRAYRKRSRIG